jgi:hypothetical protein
MQISICYNLSINSTIGAFPIEEKDNRKIILEKKNCISDFFFFFFFWKVFFWWQHCTCGLRVLEPIRALKDVVHVRDMRKAEALFKKMRDLEFPITVYACNQMITLYKKLDKKRVANILLLMEKENVKPSLLTYGLLIDIKGASNDIVGMEQLFETMKAE